MQATGGKSRVLDWILDAIGNNTDEKPIFVAGYRANDIKKKYQNLEVVENTLWETTGPTASLFCTPFDSYERVIVCYSDVLFRKSIIQEILNNDFSIAIGYDSSWRTRYAHRTEKDLERCEKVIVKDNSVLRLGSDIPTDWADGEFTGLVCLNSDAITFLRKTKNSQSKGLEKANLTGLLELIRNKGFTIKGFDLKGNWAEVKEAPDIAQFVLGTKAETLSRLKELVKHSRILPQISFTVEDWKTNSERIKEDILDKFENQHLVVRSSARTEDSFTKSNAGAYTSLLNVDPGTGLDEAIKQVINSYQNVQKDDQVLIQPMLKNIQLSGVAFTRVLEHGGPYYSINYSTDGSTEAITSGRSDNHFTLMIRRSTKKPIINSFSLQKLFLAIQEVEGLLNYDSLDIEFAIDKDDIIYILQVRPIVVKQEANAFNDEECHKLIEEARKTWYELEPATPNLAGGKPLYGLMPDWNPAEIIGTRPGALANSLYRNLIMDEVWATQRAEYGYRDVRPQPLLVNFARHPYVDVRASFTSFIPASIPEKLASKLVNFYLNCLRQKPELHDKVEFEIIPTCMAPGFESWEETLKHHGGFNQKETNLLREALLEITANAFSRCQDDLNNISILEKRFVDAEKSNHLSPIEKARILLEDCKRFGTLPFAHLARSGFIAVTLLRRAVETGIISESAQNSFMSSVNTISQQLTTDAYLVKTNKLSWESFCEKYGHLRPGTYDITSQRYDADPDRFLNPLVNNAKDPGLHKKTTEWDREKPGFLKSLEKTGLPSKAENVEPFLRDAIAGREYAKFIFSRSLSSALEALATFGAGLGISRNDLAEIPYELLLAERDRRNAGIIRGKELVNLAIQGRNMRKIANCCELPPLLTGPDDFDAFTLGSDTPNFIGSKSITADCTNMAANTDSSEIGLKDRIVIIPQADPGYDWLFGHGIAGLITLFGGANSHMAIRAAEFDLPAAIGVGEQRYKQLTTANTIELNPPSKILRVIQ